jgi:Carboxypeptidase regulatory-like domain
MQVISLLAQAQGSAGVRAGFHPKKSNLRALSWLGIKRVRQVSVEVIGNVLGVTKKTGPAILVFLWLAGQWAVAQSTGGIQGTVTDSTGAPILGAVVTVKGADGNPRTTVTDTGGAFKISSLALGNYSVKISAAGMSDWTASNVRASATPESNPLRVVLLWRLTNTVTATLSRKELAADQVKQESKQRVLGIIPNYYVNYDKNPAPLSPKQKFRLSWKTLVDPTTIAAAGITAGIQQEKNSYHQWGQGAEAYGKRFGAAYATAATNLLITSTLAESLLHQDPRYFYSGQGTKGQRAKYAVESAFRTKGDNGKWQPPYAGVMGTIATAEIANLYYPGSRTQYTLLGRSLMFHFAGLIALNLTEEFLAKRVTHKSRRVQPVADPPVLPEGTPVPLIALGGFGAGGATLGQTVTFVLTQDLTLHGKVLARTGDIASGQVSQVTAAKDPGAAGSVAIQNVTLRAGNVNVPLRSNQVRGVAGAVQYKKLQESGKTEVILFVGENVQFPEDK